MFSESKEAWLAFCLLNTSVNQAINPELWNGTLKKTRTFFTQSKILILVTNTLTLVTCNRSIMVRRLDGGYFVSNVPFSGMPYPQHLGLDGGYSVSNVPFSGMPYLQHLGLDGG